MSADKRTVTTDALETLGNIIGAEEKRDAIHLAVEPVVAASWLTRGQDVGFLPDGRVGVVSNPVGIVDPFLGRPVKEGERFWLVVYPRQITSLRHVWEHPAFPASGETNQAIDQSEKAISERWIRDFADRVSLHYSDLMDGAEDWVSSKKKGGYGEYLCFGGLLEGEHVPDEFWGHYQVVTGLIVAPDHQGSFFTCSC